MLAMRESNLHPPVCQVPVHVKYVGPLTAQPPQPLSPDLEAFVSGALQGLLSEHLDPLVTFRHLLVVAHGELLPAAA